MMKAKDITAVYPRKVEGRLLKTVFDCGAGWKETAVDTRVPDGSKLFNFDIPYGDTTLLVLDPYGDEDMAGQPKMLQRVAQHPVEGGTIAIDRKSGQVYHTGFYRTQPKGSAAMGIWAFEGGYRVPKRYLRRLDELKSQKRPFSLSVLPSALMLFIDREYGFEDLRKTLTVTLWFHKGKAIQLWGGAYRTLSTWEDTYRR